LIATTLENVGQVTSLDISGSMDTSGVLHDDFEQYNIRYSGNNQIVNLEINSGTRVVASDGSPVESISIQSGTNVPQPPSGESIVSAVEFGPSGTLFSSPITVVFGYDPTLMPKNVKAGSLALEWYDTETNKWENCDYSIDILNYQITANISHFSLYAVMVKESSGFAGLGWSWAGIIIIGEVILGFLLIYYFLRRRKSVVLESAGANQSRKFSDVEGLESKVSSLREAHEGKEPARVVNWDDILTTPPKKGEPFETHLEITGGKIVIPRDGKSPDIEITNNPDIRIVITLRCDHELYPGGLAKIMVLGPASEYEKLKEIGK
jgi:hypothetical protein